MRYIADVSGSANYRGPWPSQPSDARRPFNVADSNEFVPGKRTLDRVQRVRRNLVRFSPLARAWHTQQRPLMERTAATRLFEEHSPVIATFARNGKTKWEHSVGCKSKQTDVLRITPLQAFHSRIVCIAPLRAARTQNWLSETRITTSRSRADGSGAPAARCSSCPRRVWAMTFRFTVRADAHVIEQQRRPPRPPCAARRARF